MNRPLVAACVLLLFFAVPCRAGVADAESTLPADSVARLDALVESVASAGAPGLALVIVDRQGIRYEAYRGLANLEWQTPIGPGVRFYLGSLSKQFTAAAVLDLVRQGKLALDTSVRSLLPELPAYSRPITVRDLIHHTSGLRDYLKLRQVAGQSDEEPFDNASALGTIIRQKGLVFAPGSRYQYSNSNYVLLAEILARVTGESLPDFARRRVFDPAGLDETSFESEPGVVLPLRVQSYRTPAGQPSRRFVKMFSAFGDGGVYSTPRNLARWAGILLRRDIFDPSFYELFLEPDGRLQESTYAFGLHVRSIRGVPVIEHGGSMLGFEHWMALFPREGTGFVLLTNDKTFDAIALREQLTEILVGDALAPVETSSAAPQPKEKLDSEPDASDFAALPEPVFGRYHNDEIPVDLILGRNEDGIVVTPSTFRPVPARQTGASRLEAMGGFLTIDVGGDPEHPVLRVGLRDLGIFEFRPVTETP